MSKRATKSAAIAAAVLSVAATSVLGQVTFNIGLGIRESGVDSVPIGGNGGATGGIEFIGFKPEPAPIQAGKPLVADGSWQTITFTFGTDTTIGFAGATADSQLTGTRGAIEHLGFQNTAGVSDRIAFFIDDVYNVVGGTPILIDDFDSYAAVATPSNGAPEVMFRDPRFSGSTNTHLLTNDTANVTAESASSGDNSYRLGFQFVDSNTNRWIRLTTNGAATKPNPAIDFSPGNSVTMRVRAIVIPELVGWNLDGDGSYNTPENWVNNAVPNGTSAIARFGTGATITAPRTVTIEETPTVNTLMFKSAQSFTLAAAEGHGLLLRAPAGFDANITVEEGNHTLTTGLETGARLALNVVRAQDQLTLTGPIYTTDMTSLPPVKVVDAIKTGAGKAVVTKLDFDQLTITGGTLAISNDAGTSRVNGLSVSAAAKLDLGNNAIVVDYGESATPITTPETPVVTSSYTTQRNRIIAGRNGGTWDGNGIMSSALTANQAIAIIEATEGDYGTDKLEFRGAAIDDTAVIIAVALKGDVNLDDTVNFEDLLALAQNYDPSYDPATTPKRWNQGDSDYNGIVNFDDLLGLAQNYGGNFLTASELAVFGEAFAADWALAQSLVPEPATLGLIAGIGIVGLRRRR